MEPGKSPNFDDAFDDMSNSPHQGASVAKPIRNNSVVRKCQLIAVLLGAIITILGAMPVRILDEGLVGHEKLSNFLFGLWMTLAGPTMSICRLFGIDHELHNRWVGFALEVFVNSLLCFIIGTFIGVAINLVTGVNRKRT
jgi:hypothetical protein